MTAVEWLQEKYKQQGVIFNLQFDQAKEMEKEQMIDFAKMHVKIALKAVENEMILQASSVKHWYLPQNIK
jgi:hypothetical protein